ncbi:MULTISPECIES: NAD(P)-dependent oxidoreductase [Enterococcus]|uniref:2-hydroxy-3-oxopropionate reductase n=1 Tax=Enterococcus dispar ATCC 51266 TaxID=1139219 RepID=S1NGR8_9ENTE|nr:NAD(P)-dependent oxidoreductase [Enterococcus dispar]EOT42651.1 2-hydroxy-3-oxopropionate reductase [Enterococcus dispar ATCC 51266]EOW84898.1 2-hydroxy-3-oxopropionate reductase [Enterococcus dispar ATCC 51266]OJG37965.1 2-hydroxy-3-oxopropionate reductase [Enterococcus dispar]WCG33504.1 NAD(P)-dependent oxidoreductase [Enterococcus dispar]
MKIGFIGIGVMGHSMASHLLAAGNEVYVYNRTKSKADQIVEKGAIWRDTPKAVAESADVIFSIVGYPQDVEEIYYGENGIFTAEVKGKILVDMTTSTPSLAEKIAHTAMQKGASALDAPVSGGDLGAKNATLTIMVGGTQSAYEKVLPLFKIIGKSYALHGGPGKGQHTKMANQIMIAGTMTGMTEMLVYAKSANLDLTKVIETVGGGSAANWSLANYAPRILKEDYTPGFFVKHFIKDLKIALAEAEKMEIDLPATKEATRLYELLAKMGYENDGTQALIKLWWGN